MAAFMDRQAAAATGVPIVAGFDPGCDERTVFSIRMAGDHAAPHVERIRVRIRDQVELYWDRLMLGYLLDLPEQRAMVDQELTKRLNAAADATYVPPTPEEWRERARQELYAAFKAMVARGLPMGVPQQGGY